ncbi:MAG: molybdopterin-dependent oxidoreductase [bacterium]
MSHSQPTTMLNIQLDGEWVQSPSGLNVIETAKRFGKLIPHYCYHPKLEIAGNCRMCFFEQGVPQKDAEGKFILGGDGKPQLRWLPRPQIACGTKISEGMGIRTNSPLIQECRKGVLEFLLINHPLDCPICDKAGECKLQEFSSDFSSGRSRFIEEKVKKSKQVDLGARIILDNERCILCSRCVRFTRDILRDDVLGFVKRGGQVALAAHPDRPFNNEYSLNTVDICPVGALTSKDFRFKMRSWFLKETKSVCASCGTGCNVTISSRESKIYRLTPRVNEGVNSHWMCDFGRLDFHHLEHPDRFRQPLLQRNGKRETVAWQEIYESIRECMKPYQGEQVAVIASARMTNEELFLLRRWADAFNVGFMDIVPRSWQGDDFLKSQDRNPNASGAQLLGISHGGEKLSSIRENIANGKIRALFVFHEDPTQAGITEEMLSQLDLLAFVGLLPNAASSRAHFILPSAGFAEKDGTMINVKGRLQRLRRAVLPPVEALDDWRILCELSRETSAADTRFDSASAVFSAMIKACAPLRNISWDQIGDEGIQLNLA